ncbi:ATP-dependent DNA ligase [Glutamicibacter sp. NPDC087344]|uniref:ATP-dependent DNA ligase n=1 Tax=Glutamicibacter sp. NPDC087344 TaxID=3363994 RepID=UPI003829209B
MTRREQEHTVTVDGHTLKLSNLDKVLYPETGTTKAEVIDYLQRVAPALLPHAAWRPATRKRWVDGVGAADHPGKVFFRKDLEDSAPSWIPRAELEHQTHTNTYPLANEAAVLAWFGQVDALELHVPQWRFDAALKPQNPDRMVLDLDPGPGAGLAQCAEVALLCRGILDGMDLRSYPVTSGAKGIHLYAALDGTATSGQVNEVAKQLAASLEAKYPKLVVAHMKKSLRENRVLVDWSQNNAAKTTVCPYSLRGRSHPTVAAPRTWEEIESSKLEQLDFHQVLERLSNGIDPLADLAQTAQQEHDRLSIYRSKRDAQLTPEPVPQPQPATDPLPATNPAAENPVSFVIQEHHASRLHWDFRLEHDGVLVSWAVPKGPPLQRGIQRLAVMTEDHPLDYGTFDGTIPKGQYGAGEVAIWDSGQCVIEKWREDQEIIVALSGREDGGLGGKPRRYALIHARGMGDDKNWLLQLTKEQPSSGPTSPEASPEAELFSEVPKPMLASWGTPEEIIEGDDWCFEMKWDGYRAIATVHSGVVKLLSRNGNDMTADFPELQELSALAPEGSILDGEIVALDPAARPSFSLLQQRVSHRRNNRLRQAQAIRLNFMLFDALQLPRSKGGKVQNLIHEPYVDRRKYLEHAIAEGHYVKVPQAHTGPTLAAALKTSLELGLEGVLAKECTGDYEPGRRSGSWVKIKHLLDQEAVVIGWTKGQGTRAASVGSLLLALPAGDGLEFIGRVGTGFSDLQLRQIRERLEKAARKTPPVRHIPAQFQRGARWVTPKYVAEVRYSELTKDGRLRHPVWRGWRDDKDPAEVRWEGPSAPAKEQSQTRHGNER